MSIIVTVLGAIAAVLGIVLVAVVIRHVTRKSKSQH